MKLLIDLQGAQTESRYRGIGRQARALAASLIQMAGAHEVRILLNAGMTDGLDDLYREFSALLPAGSIHLFDIPGRLREIEPANLWRMRATELHREAFIANLKPDVLYLSSLFEGVGDDAVTSIGLMQSPYATVATLFDLIPLYDKDAHLAAGFMRNFYYRRAQSLKRADRLVAISQSAKNEAVDMLQFPADRIDVALLAADQSFKKSELSEEEERRLRHRYGLPESFIFYVGAIEPRKNIPLIIEAFGKLAPAERRDTALVFGGRLSESERMQLQTAAVRSGVDSSRLLLPGFIAEADLAPLYSLSSLFIFPSIREGFGLPPLEAMACGAPVLVARNSSLPEVVGREDQLFGTFDADHLARKMGRVLTDKAYADELRAWGVERAAQFSWEKTGRLTLESIERAHQDHTQSKHSAVSFGGRPRLAFVSPLPADRSGIAVYAVELLRELACYYEVECIIHQTNVTDPWVLANFPVRDIRFFREHADSYDFVLYQIGNSEFHTHMFDLMVEIPGVTILHDFFLSGVLDWLGNVGKRPKDHFLRELYLTHGLPALACATEEGRHVAVERYPANHVVFNNSHGVIVHSQWSLDQARTLYGDAIAGKIRHIAHLRAVRPKGDRTAARNRLGIAADAFIVATFGFVAETKLADRLLEAWALSSAARRGAALFFVGDHPIGLWGERFEEIRARLSGTHSVTVTGFTDEATYEDYLAAADMAVQLRKDTRGETSGAVLDCMAAGLPLIVNNHGPFQELNEQAVVRLPETFSTRQLAKAIDGLFDDAAGRAALGDMARTEINQLHHPATVGRAVREALEYFTKHMPSGHQVELSKAIGNLYAPVYPIESDLPQLAQVIAKSAPRIGHRRIFYDITLLTESDVHTGIERVVRSLLSEFLKQTPKGYLLEPVYFKNGQLFFARAYIARKLGIPADVLPDAPVDYDAGDIYIMLEWAAELLPRMVTYLQDFRRYGGKVIIGIYDLLPLILPHRFPDFIPEVAQRWFRAALTTADQFICISRCVADDVLKFGNALAPTRSTPIKVDYFHMGADIESSLPTKGVPAGADLLLQRLEAGKTFIMVGTLEPRKGHQQVIDAFHILWDRNVDVNLVIVGRVGWSTENTRRSIKASRENGGRLHWLSGVSDEYLERLYRSSTALIAASEAEGFGLPLIEAATRGLDLIVRDIPVFREVAGNGAYYFTAETGAEMAGVIERWLRLDEGGAAPSSSDLSPLSWSQSLGQFKQAMFADGSYGLITA